MQYRLELLGERRSKLHGKLLRKSSMIDKMTYYSWVNAAVIREEMDQFKIPSSCLCQHMKNIKVY